MADGSDAFCMCFLAGFVIWFIVMTLGSPIFILFAFFKDEWLIQDLNYRKEAFHGRYATTRSPNDRTNETFFGLYRKCFEGICTSEILDVTTFALEVASVACLFLSMLALPWLKLCLQKNKCVKYWNLCFVPLLLISAVMSLAASTYFLDKYSARADMTMGQSQLFAGYGGGFQIVLSFLIGGCILSSKGNSGGSAGQSSNPGAVTGSATANRQSSWSVTRSYILFFFSVEETESGSRTTAAALQMSEIQRY